MLLFADAVLRSVELQTSPPLTVYAGYFTDFRLILIKQKLNEKTRIFISAEC